SPNGRSRWSGNRRRSRTGSVRTPGSAGTSVRIAFTPGHSLGHQSVVCRLAQRDFVIAGDAVFNWRQMEGLAEPWRVPDRHSWERSLWEIQELRREYPYTVVVPGHDGGFWKQLEPRYAD
ncbi:MAG: MBL fold metallo-hydrolase, partial [bacterium]